MQVEDVGVHVGRGSEVKQSLLQLREKHGLNLVRLAEVAGVDTKVVYEMLMGRPVSRHQAEQILQGVEKLTGVQYILNDIDARIM